MIMQKEIIIVLVLTYRNDISVVLSRRATVNKFLRVNPMQESAGILSKRRLLEVVW